MIIIESTRMPALLMIGPVLVLALPRKACCEQALLVKCGNMHDLLFHSLGRPLTLLT